MTAKRPKQRFIIHPSVRRLLEEMMQGQRRFGGDSVWVPPMTVADLMDSRRPETIDVTYRFVDEDAEPD